MTISFNFSIFPAYEPVDIEVAYEPILLYC